MWDIQFMISTINRFGSVPLWCTSGLVRSSTGSALPVHPENTSYSCCRRVSTDQTCHQVPCQSSSHPTFPTEETCNTSNWYIRYHTSLLTFNCKNNHENSTWQCLCASLQLLGLIVGCNLESDCSVAIILTHTLIEAAIHRVHTAGLLAGRTDKVPAERDQVQVEADR